MHLVKSEQGARVWSSFKSFGRGGTLEADLQRCVFGGGAIQEACSPEMLGGHGADFLRAVAFWNIRSSAFGR